MNEPMNREIIDISIEDIVPNRFQPRLTFDTEALNELANSIKEHGIIQPLVVRRLQDKYEIIAGERRYKASTLIGMKKVPCIIMDLTDNESAEVAVIENIQRKEMTSLEEAKSYKKILDKGYLTQEELARRMGKSQSSIANKLRLLNLDEVVQGAILEEKISERHARSLLKVQNKEEQRYILGEIINKRLTVKQTEDLIKEKFGKGDNNVNNSLNGNNTQSIEDSSKPEMEISSIFKSPVVNIPKEQEEDYSSTKLSTPEVNIPNSTFTNYNNPQMNMLNNSNIINESPMTYPQNTNENNSLNIFKTDVPSSQMNSQNYHPTDIQSIINPSVLSNDDVIEETNNNQNNINNQNSYNMINNGMNVDINQMKNNAQDIIKKEEKSVNMETLLTSENKPENKFFIDLNMPDDFNTINILPEKVKNVKSEIDKKIDEFKLQGLSVTKQESDLGNTYQIIIRIDK